MIIPNNIKIVDISDANIWDNLLQNFADANIYQTWNYSTIVNLEKKVRHIALYKDNRLVSLAQVRIKTLPIIKRGIAYIFRGPLWQLKNTNNDINILTEIFLKLKEEFVNNLNLLLRIRPFLFSNNSINNYFKTPDGFIKNDKVIPYTSLLLDITENLDKIKSEFRRSWRQDLNKSQKSDITIITGNTSDLFTIFLTVYNQMHTRKKFHQYVNVERLLELNEHLKSATKIHIFIAYKDGSPIASFIGTAIGDTGIAISGGTNELGIQYNAAYLLQWEMIKWLKTKNCSKYDLGGINKKKNPGGYIWKSGITKDEIYEIGAFDSCKSIISKLIISIGESIQKK